MQLLRPKVHISAVIDNNVIPAPRMHTFYSIGFFLGCPFPTKTQHLNQLIIHLPQNGESYTPVYL